MSDVDLYHLRPALKYWYLRLIADLAAEGTEARIIQGWRDPAYQDQLHAQHISDLTGEQSKHCCMLNGLPSARAFDLGIFEKNFTVYITDGKDARYQLAGKLWEKYAALPEAFGLQMRWGGSFVHSKPDPDHFEI